MGERLADSSRSRGGSLATSGRISAAIRWRRSPSGRCWSAGCCLRRLAGAPPQAGLFTALAAGVLYAVFGTCRELDVGPSSTIAITAAAVLVPVVAAFPAQQYPVILAALAVLTGLTLLAAGALRLGLVADFLARPVLIGFISGIGVVIIVGSAAEAPRAAGRERQRARDAVAHDRVARRDRLADAGRRVRVAARTPRASSARAERPLGALRRQGLDRL